MRKILLKRTLSAGRVITPAEIDVGELVLNLGNGDIVSKNGSGAIIKMASNANTLNGFSDTDFLKKTTYTPNLSTPETNQNEISDVTITIYNYNSTLTYVIITSHGTHTRSGNTITWTLPNVSVDTPAKISVYSTDGFNISSTTQRSITIKNLPVATPTLSATSSSYNEKDVVSISITNYDSSLDYVVAVNGGAFTRTNGSISWTLPEVTTDTSYKLTIYARNIYSTSILVVRDILVLNIPIVADTVIQVTDYSATQQSNTNYIIA